MDLYADEAQATEFQETDCDASNLVDEDSDASSKQKKIQLLVAALVSLVVMGAVSGPLAYTFSHDKADTTKSTTTKSSGYNIDADNRDILQILKFATNGSWTQVWPILDRKPYLVNVIPTGYCVAILHIAVLHRNIAAIKHILNMPACDIDVKTLTLTSGHPFLWCNGKTPKEIALAKRYTEITTYIEQIRQTHGSRFKEDIPRFITKDKGTTYNKRGLPLLLLTLTSYKTNFLSSTVVNPVIHFQALLKLVYGKESETWESVKSQVFNSLKTFDLTAAQLLNQRRPYLGLMEQFFYNVIKLYTHDHIYREVNTALEREGLAGYKDYRPPGHDLLLGPYILMLDVLVTYWQVLEDCNGTTYRGIPINVMEQYSVGMQFTWLSFASNSRSYEQAKTFARGTGTIFVIDNGFKNPWRPRYIANYSWRRVEEECVYPVGAQFEVTHNSNEQHVNIKLINP